jgi:hypothetical protein
MIQKKLIQNQFDSYVQSVAGSDARSAVLNIDPYRELTLLIERDGQGNPIYLGEAIPGTAITDELWQIRKLTFDGQNNVTAIEFAEGSPGFNYIWSDRGDYTYS